MSDEIMNVLQDEEEDIILEGSDLHQALTNMGYNNFDSMPRAKTELASIYTELSTNVQTVNQGFGDKISFVYRYISQENRLRKQQLKAILKANILLDDHAAIINDFLNEEYTSLFGQFIECLPLISATVISMFYTLIMKNSAKNIATAATTVTLFGFPAYTKLKHWNAARKLEYFVSSQNELHDLCKQSLKILRRTIGRKSIISEVYEKNELLGSEKYEIIFSLKQLVIEIFENLSRIYYNHAKYILDILPNCLLKSCILTKIEFENEPMCNEKSYDILKNLYYSFILVQSEMMFIMANAYNGKSENKSFQIPKKQLLQVITDSTRSLTVYYSKLSKTMEAYHLSEIQPIQRVFRASPTSKWQDTYIHLDLTAQRIQSAYKEISLILEIIDTISEKNEDDLQILESITEKMNEAYKQIENAKNFAEFTSLLIAKAQHKTSNDLGKDNEILFTTNDDNRTIVIIDKDPEIEDEVFEEYIREEYLKPLYENSEGIMESFKLDKLQKKNFMSELKEALIEKQKSMNERELRALKRMYEKVRRDSFTNKSELQKSDMRPAVAFVPPPPPPPPPILKNTVIIESNVRENGEEKKQDRTPVPLPRVKMLQPDDEMPYVQTFSISECTPNFRFPPFKVSEETFVGSGENSDEEERAETSSDNEAVIDN